MMNNSPGEIHDLRQRRQGALDAATLPPRHGQRMHFTQIKLQQCKMKFIFFPPPSMDCAAV